MIKDSHRRPRGWAAAAREGVLRDAEEARRAARATVGYTLSF